MPIEFNFKNDRLSNSNMKKLTPEKFAGKTEKDISRSCMKSDSKASLTISAYTSRSTMNRRVKRRG